MQKPPRSATQPDVTAILTNIARKSLNEWYENIAKLLRLGMYTFGKALSIIIFLSFSYLAAGYN